MKTVVAILLIIGLGYFFVLRSVTKDRVSNEPSEPAAALRPHPAANPSGAAPYKPAPSVEIDAEKKWDEAGTLVRSFFEDWRENRFNSMYSRTTDSGRLGESDFYRRMAETPVHCQRFKIVSEAKAGKDWDVELSVDVTDLLCLIAASTFNAQIPPGQLAGGPSFGVTPAVMGIEQFMTIKQKWRVVNENGKLVIDLGHSGATVKRASNIMNYVLDAGDMEPPRVVLPMVKFDRVMVLTVWTMLMGADLNKSEAELDRLMAESRPLTTKAIRNMTVRLNEYRAQRGEPPVPTDF
jgi:hypothetical protein